ncbi:RNB domain-containing ribonuclease [Streptomyces sp. NPDC001135]
MPRRKIRVTGAPEAPLRAALAALRGGLGLPRDFPPQVRAEAERAAKSPVLPSYDATDIPFFTLDPPASTDLDQAIHLSRQGTGYRVRYAIADVAAFVVPGGALDAEAHRRVNTLYFPDDLVPLHPAVLSEDAACLLPDRVRPAVLWTIDLDAEGRTVAVDVRRALVRSRADRYASEICLAAVAGQAPPDWVLAALDALPRRMADGSRIAATVERACVDVVEAALLEDRVGDVFDGCVVDVDEHRPGVGTVRVDSPAVVGRIEGDRLPLGERLRVRLGRADPGTAEILFRPV